MPGIPTRILGNDSRERARKPIGQIRNRITKESQRRRPNRRRPRERDARDSRSRMLGIDWVTARCRAPRRAETRSDRASQTATVDGRRMLPTLSEMPGMPEMPSMVAIDSSFAGLTPTPLPTLPSSPCRSVVNEQDQTRSSHLHEH